MYGCASWTVKKAERRRIDAFELLCWRKLLRVLWTARRSSESILKEISPGCSLEGMMLKLKLQYSGHLLQRVHSDSRPSSRWCHPAISSSVVPFSSCPQSFPASVFSNESTLRMRWPKYWSFSFSISPSNDHPGLISFTMDWLDLLAVQGTLKSLLQHHSSKASILRRSAFFTVQLSHPYMTTGKTIALTRRTFVGKVISQLFNMLSKLVIIFHPRSVF